MRKLRFRNNHVIGGIWIDARISDGSRPFSEEPDVKGFPRLLDYNVFVEIELPDGCDLLYRMEADPIGSVDDDREEGIYYGVDIFKVSGDLGEAEVGGTTLELSWD